MNFSNIFKTKKNYKKRNFQPNADFYWKIVMGAAFALCVVFCAFGAYLFIQINKDFASLDAGASDQTQKISKDRINKVLDYFADRKNKSVDILNSPSPIVDPSL